jgi:hypothetical protein
METIIGIFKLREDAAGAVRGLQSIGFEEKNVILLYPDRDESNVRAIPSQDAEQPGMGKALGSVVGGAAGLGAGAAIAGFLIPGVGPVLAMTFGAVALGIGGAAAGAAAGDALEEVWTRGVPKDEVFFYEDALRQGRTLLIALAEDPERLESGRRLMERWGAEALNAAREKWWIGLRDVEAETYSADSADVFRRGFEAALEPENRGRSLEQLQNDLHKRYPSEADAVTFRRGFERGRQYYEKIAKQ